MKKIPALLVCSAICLISGLANAQVITSKHQENLDKTNLGGGDGIIKAAFAFKRENANPDQAIKEISWLTLNPGTSIGYHKHVDNEDAYIIISGNGIFKDSDGTSHNVTTGDVTIVRKGESHGLMNNSRKPLLVLDVVAAQQ